MGCRRDHRKRGCLDPELQGGSSASVKDIRADQDPTITRPPDSGSARIAVILVGPVLYRGHDFLSCFRFTRAADELETLAGPSPSTPNTRFGRLGLGSADVRNPLISLLRHINHTPQCTQVGPWRPETSHQ